MILRLSVGHKRAICSETITGLRVVASSAAFPLFLCFPQRVSEGLFSSSCGQHLRQDKGIRLDKDQWDNSQNPLPFNPHEAVFQRLFGTIERMHHIFK